MVIREKAAVMIAEGEKETRDAHRGLREHAKVKYYYEAGSQGARVTYTNRRSIQKERERGKATTGVIGRIHKGCQ
jgi:hypothetical protein